MENRLIQVDKGAETTSFEYGANGLRFKKQTPQKTTYYRYNTNGEVIAEVDSNQQVLASYVRGDRLLVKKEAATGKDYYYLYNGHGDVIQLVDRSGNIVNRYSYDEWGNVRERVEGTENSFLYAGEQYDQETGLYYLRARYYDPRDGRFINEDTYEGQVSNPLSLNLYTYVYNNPLIYVDPSGNDAIIINARDAAKHQGHTSILFQDSNGDWYYTYYGDEAVYVQRIDDKNAMNSLEDFNNWNNHNGLDKNTTNYTSSVYIAGDFTASLAYFNEQVKFIDENKNDKNDSYRLLWNNCLIVSMKALELGVLNDGTLLKDYMPKYVRNSIRPNSVINEFREIFYNNAFTKTEYTKQLESYESMLESKLDRKFNLTKKQDQLNLDNIRKLLG